MKDEMNLNSPFAYAAWVLEDTQKMILNDLVFLSRNWYEFRLNCLSKI